MFISALVVCLKALAFQGLSSASVSSDLKALYKSVIIIIIIIGVGLGLGGLGLGLALRLLP